MTKNKHLKILLKSTTSWNEWRENTYIEPSERYGDKYLRITREYVNKWKDSRPDPKSERGK